MMPKELKHIKQKWIKSTGLPCDNNHDPSNILFVDGIYYLWVTQHMKDKPFCGFRNSKIMVTTSPDGYNWTPLCDALIPSDEGWDCAGVLTANVTVSKGLYYMFYTGVDQEFDESHSDRYVGIAYAERPDGPWRKYKDNPILGPSGQGFDMDSVDDVTVLEKDGTFCLYYKGMYPGLDGNHTKIGMAVSDQITGPYTRYEGNPLTVGHAFAIWPYKHGFLYLSGRKDTDEGTVYNDDPCWEDSRGTQSLFWSEDGLTFEPCCHFINRAPGIYVGSKDDITKCWGVSVKTNHGGLGRYLERFDFVIELDSER